MLTRSLSISLLLLALGVLGCPSGDDDDAANDDDATANDDDSGDDDDATANDDDSGPGDDDDSGPGPGDDDDSGGGPIGDDDDSSASGGWLTGTISRSVTPIGDAIGPITVILLDEAPAKGTPPGTPIEVVLLGVSDLSGNNTVNYEMYGIPPRTDPYVLSVFMDDDGSGGPPSAGDLFAFDNGAPIEVVVDTESEFSLDIVMDTVAE